MERFFAADLQQDSTEIWLSAEESRHLTKAFRKRQGDQFLVVNGKGLQAVCVLDRTVGSKSAARVISGSQLAKPIGAKICIALSTIRPGRLDWAVEKLSELGIGTIQLLTTRHTSVSTYKAEHLNKIAISALKQSQNGYLPQILPPVALDLWLPGVASSGDCLVAHQAGEASSHSSKKPVLPLTIIIGPEGGFHSEEIEFALNLGCRLMDLGDSVLRSETAAICAAATVLSHFRNG